MLGFLDGTFADYHTHGYGEYFIASRFPILATEESPGQHPAFLRATIDSPLGPLDVFTTHPLSPRKGFEAVRGDGLREGLANGRVLRGEGAERVVKNTDVRARQLAELAAAAAASTHMVIIAGDTNLPALSPLYRETLGRFQDGFAEVGRGFGYTFPAHRGVAWLRIDRILAGPELRFVRFQVGRRKASDHFAVWADLERR
jgi:hypothetical protein